MALRMQRGSALIVGLVFLLVLTIVGVAGMKIARLELVMAGNEQFYTQATNAADAAIEAQLADGRFNPAFTTPSNPVTANTPPGMLGLSTIRYVDTGTPPGGGFSDDVLAFYFQVNAEGQAPPGALARGRIELRQGVYVLAPGN